jgi:hypothetical protein
MEGDGFPQGVKKLRGRPLFQKFFHRNFLFHSLKIGEVFYDQAKALCLAGGQPLAGQ